MHLVCQNVCRIIKQLAMVLQVMLEESKIPCKSSRRPRPL